MGNRITSTGVRAGGPVTVQGNLIVYANPNDEVLSNSTPVKNISLKARKSVRVSALTIPPKTIHWSMEIHGFPPRAHHAAVVVGNRIYSFGGYNKDGHLSYSRFGPIDIFVLKTHKSDPQWKCVSFGRNKFRPNQRFGHSAVSYKKCVLIFGGKDTKENKYSHSVYRFSVQTMKWDKPKVGGIIPEARMSHSSVVIGNMMLVFGGFNSDLKLTNVLYSLNLDTFQWSTVQTNGIPPTLRWGQSVTVYKERFVLIFGGYDTKKAEVVDTTLCFCVESKEWIYPKTKGNPPQSRCFHSSFMHNGHMYIFGGSPEFKSYLNDLFSYDPDTMEWKKVIAIGQPPSARNRAGHCSLKNRVYIFGGISFFDTHLDDTCVLGM